MPIVEVFPMRPRVNRGWTAIARVLNPNGAYIIQATLSKVEIIVQRGSGTVTLAQTALTIANVVFDTLQTSDARWTKDSTGFNFLYEVPASAFPGNDHYRVEVLFTPSSGEKYSIVWEGATDTSFTFTT